MKPTKASSRKKNDLVKLTVTDVNNLGAGVGRLENEVVFVKGGCTGDELLVKIIKVASSYLVARIEKILKPSPYRTDPRCPAASRCGGCTYRHLTYEHELALKKQYVISAMKKAGLTVSVNDVLTTGVTDGYRNKAEYPIGCQTFGKAGREEKKIAIGFYAERTHEIIPCVSENEEDFCLLEPPLFGKIAAFVRNLLEREKIEPYNEVTKTGSVRHLYLRRAETTGETMLCLVTKKHLKQMKLLADELSGAFPEIVSVYENINPEATNVVLGREFHLIKGKAKITDSLCGKQFMISPESFYQVNRSGAEMLYNKAAELANVKDGERVIDLFCGIGTVGLSVAPKNCRLTGIEIVEGAVRNAEENAKLNGCENASFYCLDAADPAAIEEKIGAIAEEGCDVIILDPPRKGCSPELLETLSRKTTARIVYISCNPDTLARDMALLTKLGYTSSEVTPVDMFPRTGHVETVVLMSRK